MTQQPTPQELQEVVEAVEAVAKTIGPWTNCPHCDAPPTKQHVRNYDPLWHDGDVYCGSCGGYVRMFDAG